MMKRKLGLWFIVGLLMISLAGCGSLIPIEKKVMEDAARAGLELSMKSMYKTMKFVVENNYGDKITDIKSDDRTFMSFTLMDEIYVSQKVTFPSIEEFEIFVSVNAPNEERYYPHLENILKHHLPDMSVEEVRRVINTKESKISFYNNMGTIEKNEDSINIIVEATYANLKTDNADIKEKE